MRAIAIRNGGLQQAAETPQTDLELRLCIVDDELQARVGKGLLVDLEVITAEVANNLMIRDARAIVSVKPDGGCTAMFSGVFMCEVPLN